MSLPIRVGAYSGFRAHERPRFIIVDANFFEVAAVEDRWYEPEAEYFKVRTLEGKRLILRYSERADEWSLQSGFDGEELLARPGIELITVDPASIRNAESAIAGCERCRPEEAGLPLDYILKIVLGKHDSHKFLMTEVARCPNCQAALSEAALVQPFEQVHFRKTEWGLYYAVLHHIVPTGMKGNRCPLLRTIAVDDFGCENLWEAEADEGTFLDFTYKQTRFTCELLNRGSELYPASATQSTQMEQELLGEIALAIARRAEERLQ